MLTLARLLARYARHVRADIRRGVAFEHHAADAGRLLGRCRPGDPVISSPPHEPRLYAGLLERLQQDRDVRFMSLAAYAAGEPSDPAVVTVCLRHDLDGGRIAVIEALCEVERQFGLSSSVHVLVDGQLYAPEGLRDAVARLVRAGFDVGLHTQAWMGEDERGALARDLDRFQELFGFRARTMSLHGAWPRTADHLKRRRQFERQLPALVAGTGLAGYNNRFDWVSEDSNVQGRARPLHRSFLEIAQRCYLGGAGLVLTHDEHWLTRS